ncbi:MAG: type III pantothenate kinase [Methylococcales bacterium]|nr:type III pantothenate kinase [Methylococcales bacterium]
MKLLVDMGNTRLKWATINDAQLITGEPLLNTQLNRQALLKLWQPLVTPTQLVIACVTANQSLALVMAVAVSLWADINIVRVSSQAQGFGLTNAYLQPEKLGVDRWLALIAARHFYAVPACVVDCGTAITVDLIDADGHHLGGLISAGLALMKKSLAHGTDALPFSDTLYPLEAANSTEAAIYSGTLLAAIGLIEQVLAKHSDVLVILTGGDAALIASHLSIKAIVDPDLVLRGLAIAADKSTD